MTPARAARDGQQKTFGEQLADEAFAAGAHCGAHRKFLAAGEGTGEQQIGEVGATDEEYAERGAEQCG